MRGRHAKRVGGGGRLERRATQYYFSAAVGVGEEMSRTPPPSQLPPLTVSAEFNLDSPKLMLVCASVAGINSSALRLRGHRLARHAFVFSRTGRRLRRSKMNRQKYDSWGVKRAGGTTGARTGRGSCNDVNP